MANKTSWVAGAGTGFTWADAISTANLASLANGSTQVGAATITNQTALDQFIDLSLRLIISSSTIAAGANITTWLYMLLDDGSTYGDGQFTPGTAAAKTPLMSPLASFPLVAAATQTALIGQAYGLQIPPGSFKFALQNNSGFALTAGSQILKYRSYNINLNA